MKSHRSPSSASPTPSFIKESGPRRIREIAERHLLYDVAELATRANEDTVGLALTGGLATRAYTGPIRFTHDADFVAFLSDYKELKRILKDMGYKGERRQFGKGEILFTSRHIENRRQGITYNLEFDISLDGIFDHSSGIHYPATSRLLEDSRMLPIRGYFPSSRSILVNARVLGIEDLFLLKTMTVLSAENNREKDIIDAFLICLKHPPDMVRLWSIAEAVGIGDHIRDQIEGKLIKYLDSGKQEKMAEYGISLQDEDRLFIRSVLSSIAAFSVQR